MLIGMPILMVMHVFDTYDFVKLLFAERHLIDNHEQKNISIEALDLLHKALVRIDQS